MTEPTEQELREHWDGCAGAEATINDQRLRADVAEAKLVQLIQDVREWCTEYSNSLYQYTKEALEKILDAYEDEL